MNYGVSLLMMHGNPEKPVTYLAERGIATQTEQGIRVVMFNGSQQLIDRKNGRLTLFYFDQYSLDLGVFNQEKETPMDGT